MPAPGRFGAVICAMVTPFDEQGGLDIAGAVKLARWLVENGNDGLVLTGTTGEATTLSDSEKVELWKAVRQAVAAPVLAGTGTASTAHSVELPPPPPCPSSPTTSPSAPGVSSRRPRW